MKLQEVQRISPIREIVFQYRDLLKQLTGQSTNRRFSVELKDILAQNENYELIPHLEQVILEFKVHVQNKFWKELAEIMTNEEYNLKFSENQEKDASEENIRHYYKGSKNRLYLGTTFKLDSFSWRQTEIALRVELGEGGWVYYGFILFDEDGKRVESCDDKIFDTPAGKLCNNGFKHTKWWLGWKYPAKNLQFLVEYSDSITDILLDDSRRELVKEFATEISDAVKQLKQNLN